MPHAAPLHRTPGVSRRDYQQDYRQRLATPEGQMTERLRGTERWKRARRWILRASPLCANPYGLHDQYGVLAEEVDHIIPVRERPDLFLIGSNLQGLCRNCHTRKSGIERRHG